jgi:hypothetical protein
MIKVNTTTELACNVGQKPCGALEPSCIPEDRTCCNVLDFQSSEARISYDTLSCPSGFHCENKARGVPLCCKDGHFACIDIDPWYFRIWGYQSNARQSPVCCKAEEVCFGRSNGFSSSICQRVPIVGTEERQTMTIDPSASPTALFVIIGILGGNTILRTFD